MFFFLAGAELCQGDISLNVLKTYLCQLFAIRVKIIVYYREILNQQSWFKNPFIKQMYTCL